MDNPIPTEDRIVGTAPPPPQAHSGCNGASVAAPDPERAAQADDAGFENGKGDRVTSAEQMVDRFAERVAGFTSRWGRRVLWVGARFREGVSDMWAEAQSIRHGDQK